jgi:uncharacterized protein YegL
MPERVTHRVALAVIGGGYHEAWHTKYSGRIEMGYYDKAPTLEAAKKLRNLCAQKDHWSDAEIQLAVEFCHVIEDIRIERCGNRDYPGALQPMKDLQDFILNMELEGTQGTRAVGANNSPRSILLRVFRDFGLGYHTPLSQEAVLLYQEEQPEIFQACLPRGFLYPLLQKAKRLSPEDTFGAYLLAVRVLITIANHTNHSEEQQDQQDADEEDSGDQDSQQQGSSSGSGGEDGEERDSEDGDGEGEEDEGEEDEDSEERASNGEGSEDEDEGDEEDSRGGGSEDSEDSEEGDSDSNEDSREVFAEALSGDSDSGRLDASQALQVVFEEVVKKELEDLRYDEELWNPASVEGDRAELAEKATKPGQKRKIAANLKKGRSVSQYLRAKLRNIVLGQEHVDICHGVKRGRKVSSRMLVDSKADLKGRRVPQRPYEFRGKARDTSLSLAICLDLSASMRGESLEWLKPSALAVLDAIEGIQGKSFCYGFRTRMSARGSHRAVETSHKVHRREAIEYPIFKQWEEPFVSAKQRFESIEAWGSTPMADGVQYGLSALSPRREAHRVLLVVTDGQPDQDHIPVMCRQFRLAREAGVHIIGFGVGRHAKYVNEIFEDYVWINDFSEMGVEMIKKLKELLGPQAEYTRGRAIRIDRAGSMKKAMGADV